MSLPWPVLRMRALAVDPQRGRPLSVVCSASHPWRSQACAVCLENLAQHPDCAFKEESWEASLGVNGHVCFCSRSQPLLQSAVWGASSCKQGGPLGISARHPWETKCGPQSPASCCGGCCGAVRPGHRKSDQRSSPGRVQCAVQLGPSARRRTCFVLSSASVSVAFSP